MSADDTTGRQQPRQGAGMDTEAFLALNADFLASHAPNGSGPAGSTPQTSTASSARQTPFAPSTPAGVGNGAGATPAGAQKPADGSTAAINPLVAARAAAPARTEAPAAPGTASASASTTGGLYPVGDMAAARSLDVSFNERKHAGRIILTIIIILAVLAAVVGASYVVLRGKTRNAVNQSISDAWASLAVADVVVGPMGDAIFNEVENAVIDPALSEALLSSQVATNALNDVDTAITFTALQDFLMTQEQKDAASALHSAVDGRRSMISVGRQLLVNDASAGKALESLNSAFEQIAQANTQYQNSYDASVAAQSAEEGAGDMSVVLDSDNAALAAINSAMSGVADAKLSYPAADYTAIDTYLSAAQSAYTQLITLDTATANGDAESEAAAADPYYQALATMQSAAGALPADGMALLSDAYGQATAQYASSYSSAASMIEASSADVSDYLSSVGLDPARIALDAADGVTLPASSQDGTASTSSALDEATMAVAPETSATAPAAGEQTQATPADEGAAVPDAAAPDAATPATDATAEPVAAPEAAPAAEAAAGEPGAAQGAMVDAAAQPPADVVAGEENPAAATEAPATEAPAPEAPAAS